MKRNRYETLQDLRSACENGAHSLSYSGLKSLSNGNITAFVNHYLQKDEPKPTAAVEFGKIFHLYLLQPDEFAAKYEAAPKDYKTKTSQKWADLETKLGKTLILEDDIATMELMKNALLNSKNEIIKSVFETTTAKEFWFENILVGEQAKIKMYGAIDALAPNAIIDIKTTSDINNCLSDIAKYSYHLQAYVYQQVVSQLPNKKGRLLPFYLVFITQLGQYKVVQISPEKIEQASHYFTKLVSYYNQFILFDDAARVIMDEIIIY